MLVGAGDVSITRSGSFCQGVTVWLDKAKVKAQHRGYQQEGPSYHTGLGLGTAVQGAGVWQDERALDQQRKGREGLLMQRRAPPREVVEVGECEDTTCTVQHGQHSLEKGAGLRVQVLLARQGLGY